MSQRSHLDINSWQHMLDVLYKEAVCCGLFKQFISVLQSHPVIRDPLDVKRCGLSWIAKELEKHYEVESNWLNGQYL